MKDVLIEVKNLSTQYNVDDTVVEAVSNVSFTIQRGECLGLVGETGAGKTTAALSIMNLVPDPPGKIVGGEILFEGKDLFKLNKKEMRKTRGSKISMIFQDPMTSLNPVETVGRQVAEVIRLHEKMSLANANVKAIEMLELVGIMEERVNDYPHQFSGGMKQRVIIAIALACEPSLLIADEPTTALDVTIQAQVLELIRKLQKELNTSMLLITHDLGVVAETCEKVAIMYAGEIIEFGTLEHIYENTKHPYTLGLFKSIPNLNENVRRLSPIIGLMPDPTNLPVGCNFAPRCPDKTDKCMGKEIETVEVEEGHYVKCVKYINNGE